MTPTDQRIALAKHLGWTKDEITGLWMKPNDNSRMLTSKLPPYDTSLDALHEVECGLTEDQKHEYLIFLAESSVSRWAWFIVNADAPTRLAALCKTLGLWTDTTLSTQSNTE